MKTKQAKTPLIENGVIVGTASNKYELKNPIARYLLAQFSHAIVDLACLTAPERIIEIGCGEGYVTKSLLKYTAANIMATDISRTVLEQAKADIQSSRVQFKTANIHDLNKTDAADLVVCCEVLEHLQDPDAGLKKISELAAPYALLSVPREPLWRILNFSRGAYMKEWGNSPGHIQHWSKRQFFQIVNQYFDVISMRSPIPWTVVLAKSRKQPQC